MTIRTALALLVLGILLSVTGCCHPGPGGGPGGPGGPLPIPPGIPGIPPHP